MCDCVYTKLLQAENLLWLVSVQFIDNFLKAKAEYYANICKKSNIIQDNIYYTY